ncbi:uncharacterized protein LOC107359857 [Tetranychus urticae]|uniref:Dynein light chain n=1 Tax=Tetranychus urticae TaxID=32264 RepID=T1K3K6_TETUR|nr:uncharacterized protein LOC107359857 [Tetranychus urticae]XP_015781929.1 uncharacterized protein LOC107359857 [Tetranychus urticae]XP_025016158.1 uncharacterized protein LOC107359857 [Tetranychus urticae]XP_025016159.1 uncharacterized protein LOC107359857 [Tetranychus urticae]
MSRSMRSNSSPPSIHHNAMDVNHKSFCYILLKNLYLSAYYPEGLSFLALILLTAKLYDVNKEVTFLSYMSTVWLPNKIEEPTTLQDKSRSFHIENLRSDFDILIVELWSSRTTLILSVIFVLIYIFSWAWMAYAVRETRNVKDVSLTTVLLLAVFAAVDIAASSGFVMVRMIMLFIRDHHFPKDMRIPGLTEHDQLTAYAALRIAVLQSSPGNTDIFVSVIIGFLTGLRVYSVVCAVSFYNKVRKGDFKSNHLVATKERSVVYCTDNASDRYSSHLDEFFKKSAPYMPSEDGRRKDRHKERSKDRGDRHHYSTTNSTAVTDVEVIEKEMKIQAADMPMHMQRKALQIASQAVAIYATEKLIAESIKQDFDAAFEPTWHCIVGRNWGSCVTHSKQCYIRLLYKDLTILLYKST